MIDTGQENPVVRYLLNVHGGDGSEEGFCELCPMHPTQLWFKEFPTMRKC